MKEFGSKFTYEIKDESPAQAPSALRLGALCAMPGPDIASGGPRLPSAPPPPPPRLRSSPRSAPTRAAQTSCRAEGLGCTEADQEQSALECGVRDCWGAAERGVRFRGHGGDHDGCDDGHAATCQWGSRNTPLGVGLRFNRAGTHSGVMCAALAGLPA
eukprot:665867-Rhodomonas_salina.3